mmetsp:Transcript_11617/g.16276  ORF Transcript_11617/g.16276 Transcript_11617/m.16276 type:complete len:271 (-) Transcript_11617:499-1311(-)
MQHVWFAGCVDTPGTVAGLHTQKVNHSCHSIFHFAELQGKLFQNFIFVTKRFPSLTEIGNCHLGHKVRGSHRQIFQGIFFFKGITLFFTRGRVHLYDCKFQFTRKGARCQGRSIITVTLQNTETILLVTIAYAIGGHFTTDLPCLRVGIINCHSNIVQALFFNGIGHHKLKYHMGGEYMFDTFHHIFRFRFCERHRQRTTEGTSQTCEFWNCVNCRGRIDRFLLFRCHNFGTDIVCDGYAIISCSSGVLFFDCIFHNGECGQRDGFSLFH